MWFGISNLAAAFAIARLKYQCDQRQSLLSTQKASRFPGSYIESFCITFYFNCLSGDAIDWTQDFQHTKKMFCYWSMASCLNSWRCVQQEYPGLSLLLSPPSVSPKSNHFEILYTRSPEYVNKPQNPCHVWICPLNAILYTNHLFLAWATAKEDSVFKSCREERIPADEDLFMQTKYCIMID